MSDKVAVTYSWNRMAYIVNKSLSLKGIQVYTGDSSIINMNKLSMLGNKCFRYPDIYADKEVFIRFLAKYLKGNKIDFLIPTHEEIFIISKYLNQLDCIKTLVPDFEALRTSHKKDLSSALAFKLGIPVPLTIKPDSVADCNSFFNENEKPIVLKYENSNSSKGVFYIRDRAQLELHFDNIGHFILQEYVSGEGYGVSMLYNKGNLRASFTHKRLVDKLTTGGTSTLRTGVKNDEMEAYSQKLLDYLGWNGVAMVEYKYDKLKKKGWFIEVNPRFWGSLALPYYSGMDFPYLYYKILKEGDIKPAFEYKQGVKVKWLLGGALGFLDSLAHERKLDFSHLSFKADYFDDFSLRDPFILFGEMGFYFEKFMHSFKLNPTNASSLNIDEV